MALVLLTVDGLRGSIEFKAIHFRINNQMKQSRNGMIPDMAAHARESPLVLDDRMHFGIAIALHVLGDTVMSLATRIVSSLRIIPFSLKL